LKRIQTLQPHQLRTRALQLASGVHMNSKKRIQTSQLQQDRLRAVQLASGVGDSSDACKPEIFHTNKSFGMEGPGSPEVSVGTPIITLFS
jgi:hypothetical protein